MLFHFTSREFIPTKGLRRCHFLPNQFLTLFFFLSSIAAHLFFLHPSLAGPVSSSTGSIPERYMVQGSMSFQRGAFEQAISDWKEAVKGFEKEGKLDKQSETLTLLAQAYQYLGHYNEALKNLRAALILAEKSGNRIRIASSLGGLGNLYISIGPLDKAHQLLNESLVIAKELREFVFAATVLNNLGNLFATEKRYDEALNAYMESLALAERANHISLVARTLTHAAMAYGQKEQYQESKKFLDRAFDQIRKLEASHDKGYGLINIGLAYRHLRAYLPEQGNLPSLSSRALNEALTASETIGDLRTLSYACGYLGTVWEDGKQYLEALRWTRRAALAAQQVNAPESLYLWQWQTARLLKALGETEEAISSYRNCVYTLQSIRQEMSTCYGSPPISFREFVEPIYSGFVDLLLQHAASMKEPEQVEPFLIEAREVVELLKVAELRDYFQDECMGAAQLRITRLDTVSKAAVVIYPVLFLDRTELLVSFPSGLKRFSIKVGADTLAKEVKTFRQKLEKRTTREYLPHAQRLYDWLIRPLEPDLAKLTMDTLVFVPDGPLRGIPMSALHDGKQFLISKYAIAITPGLNLTDPRPVRRENIRVLLAGLTDSVQGFPPLPNVSDELQTIQTYYGGRSLVNQNFLISRIERELKDKQFTMMHIASHGRFENDIRKTFLLTFDGRLTMDQLEQFVGLFKFREDPLELLTLSACETAAGDDRAAMGLAGVAIKAGARSTLATLWHINDQASSELVSEFYRQLRDPSVSRAIALKRAQLKLLNDRSYQHPGYWSPFLLINNWL
jgi:CHAT domain-containing protein/Tfp pilus assembly protein PilF